MLLTLAQQQALLLYIIGVLLQGNKCLILLKKTLYLYVCMFV